MKKLLFSFLALVLSFQIGSVFATSVPNFDDHFVKPLSSDKNQINVFSDDNVNSGRSLRDNIRYLFYPSTATNGGILGSMTKSIAIGVVILFIVIAGFQLIVSGKKPEKVKESFTNLGYIVVGALFIYAAGWLFGDVLNMDSMTGVSGVATALSAGQGSAAFVMLSLLKSGAFFVAIIMIVVTGFRVMAAADADKSKKLIRGTVNVLVALFIMKGVDFVYYIAATPTFAAQAADLIITVAKFFGYLYGAGAVLMAFYAGFLYLTDAGGGSGMKKATNILVNMLVSGLVLFGFLLILYQVFAEFS